MAYTLWHNKLKETDAGKWPFPQPTSIDDNHSILGLIQGNEYVINPEEIKKCYPDCILLISLWGENKGGNFSFGFYSIMASDNVVELVEDHKVSVTLGKN